MDQHVWQPFSEADFPGSERLESDTRNPTPDLICPQSHTDPVGIKRLYTQKQVKICLYIKATTYD